MKSIYAGLFLIYAFNFGSIYYIFMYIYALCILPHLNTVVSNNPRNSGKLSVSEKYPILTLLSPFLSFNRKSSLHREKNS